MNPSNRVYTVVDVEYFTCAFKDNPAKKRAPKVVFHLEADDDGDRAKSYANVSNLRERNTAAGEAGKPFTDPKQFIPKKNSEFMRLANEAGVKGRKDSRTEYWECLHKFVGVKAIGPQPDLKGVIKSSQLTFLPTPVKEMETALAVEQQLPVNDRLSTGYRPVNDRLSTGYQAENLPVNESVKPKCLCGPQPILGRGSDQLELKAQGNNAEGHQGEQVQSWFQHFSMLVHRQAGHCDPNIDDIKFLAKRLPKNPKRRRDAMAEYFSHWEYGMGTEPVEHKKQNAGRFTANTWLRETFGPA